MRPIPRVAVLMETTYVFGRRALRGILRYQREHGPWDVLFRPHGRTDPPPKWLTQWSGDGVLARIYDERTAELLRRLKTPVVDLAFQREGVGFPRLIVDNQPIVEAAVAHLHGCGLKHLAFCGLPPGQNSTVDERAKLFSAAAERGGTVSVFHGDKRQQSAQTWGYEQAAIARWLVSLPKPVGVLACHDPRAQQVLEGCRMAGLRVPDEVAVLGVDNDEVLCELASPALSSVWVDHEQAGYAAAALLDAQFQGRPAPPRILCTSEVRVVARPSTDVLAMEDRDLAEALRFIRAHATDGITVSDVLAQVPLSRSALERRLKAAIGRTPRAEIIRIQLERVKELLKQTDLSLAAIANRCGYPYLQHLATLFKGRFGVTLAEFRRNSSSLVQDE